MGEGIRAVRADDAPGIAALLVELGYPDNDASSVRERLVTWTSESHRAVLVAAEDERIVGVVAVAAIPYLERPGRWARVVAMVTTKARRGQGIGRALMGAAEDAARRFDCAQMEVTSANRRVDAHAFYRSLGYENWSDRAGRFLKDLLPGFSDGSFAARFPPE